jgi:hypothetical protein
VNGSNFLSGARVRWNGTDRVTTFVSPIQLQAGIPAADITSANFTITTSAVSSSRRVTISANYDGVRRSTTLSVR